LALGLVGAAAWITVILGLFVILFAIEGLILPSYLEEWGEIGLWLWHRGPSATSRQRRRLAAWSQASW
jgi:hypothetical protein